MSSTPVDGPTYRPCVGIMLVNAEGRVLVANRSDTKSAEWQMPQGGIDAGETPRDAAFRELAEEVGTDKARIIAESRDWLSYDLPAELQGGVWKGRYKGQRQKWFLFEFMGTDEDIDLDAHNREFDEWKWVDPEELPALIVDFKRALYEDVLEEFSEPLTRLRGE